MKSIIFALLVTSLLLVGCSKNKPDTSDNVNSSSSVSENTGSTSAVMISSETSAKEKNESITEDYEETSVYVTDTKETTVSGGELPVIIAETSRGTEKSENNSSVTKITSPSSETNPRTSNTETEKNTGGVIELPIIPVK